MPTLLDASGTPIPPKQEIPFVRIYPNGLRGLQTIERDEATYKLACRFIAAGGRYGICIEADGTVDMVAVMKDASGEDGLAAQELANNGPELLAAVDRLVAASIANMDSLPITETLQ